MGSVVWDRLLETCLRKDASVVLLVPGSPPLMRIGRVWRGLDVPALSAEDVVDLAAERIRPGRHAQSNGYAYDDFWYRDGAFFRAMAFGFPETKVLVVSPAPPPRPPSPGTDREPHTRIP